MRSKRVPVVQYCLFVGLIGFTCIGCSASETENSDADTFLAFATTFAGYRNWSHAAATADGAPSGVHTNGPMTVYWNELPPHGGVEFPVGTTIVKETDPGVSPAQIFAMVKRGGGYNSTGARGWEWFELQSPDSDSVIILWRGVGPPNGETYGGDPTTCNTCHAQAVGNDFVWSTALQLSSF
jgi:hypothetical protein